MRRAILLIAVLVCTNFCAVQEAHARRQQVRGYYRSNGAYVNSYGRDMKDADPVLILGFLAICVVVLVFIVVRSVSDSLPKPNEALRRAKADAINARDKIAELAELTERISREMEERRKNPPMNLWDQARLDGTIIYQLRAAIHEALNERLMGSKKIDTDSSGRKVIVIRPRLAYSTEIAPYLDEERNGFDVFVPQHNFKLRITSKRHDIVPYDVLMENICKIDRSVIRGRNSKSNPLEYVPKQSPIPSLRVQVLQSRKRGGQSQPQLPS